MIDWCSALLAQNLRPVGLFLAVYDPSNTCVACACLCDRGAADVRGGAVWRAGGVAQRARAAAVADTGALVCAQRSAQARHCTAAASAVVGAWLRHAELARRVRVDVVCICRVFAVRQCVVVAAVDAGSVAHRMLVLIGAVVAARASIYVHSLEQCLVGVGIGVSMRCSRFWLVPNERRARRREAARARHNALIGSQHNTPTNNSKNRMPKSNENANFQFVICSGFFCAVRGEFFVAPLAFGSLHACARTKRGSLRKRRATRHR
jgi:hypothetical protein